MYRFLLLSALLVASACSSPASVEPPSKLDAKDVSNTEYNLLVLNDEDAAIFIGGLRFGRIDGDVVRAEWELEPWSEEPLFSNLPLSGRLTGFLHGGELFLLSDPFGDDDVMGLSQVSWQEERLSGKVDILPALEFKGRFEAVRQDAQ